MRAGLTGDQVTQGVSDRFEERDRNADRERNTERIAQTAGILDGGDPVDTRDRDLDRPATGHERLEVGPGLGDSCRGAGGLSLGRFPLGGGTGC